MATPDDVKRELKQLFPGPPSEEKFLQWLVLCQGGWKKDADDLLGKWRSEAEYRAKHPEFTNYIELGDTPFPLGFSVLGFSNIGVIKFDGNDGTETLSFEARELVQVDEKLANYFVQLTITKERNRSVGVVKYAEIETILDVINMMMRAGSNFSRFNQFEVNWANDGEFSLRVFNNHKGEINSTIKVGVETVWPESLQQFESLKILFSKAKAYIDGHLQSVGYIGFKLLEEARKTEEEFNANLPTLIETRTLPYLRVLATKYVQLIYQDEYGITEFGSFLAEVDKFIGKLIPELNDQQRAAARDRIAVMAEEFANDPENNIARLDSDMDPLDYERYCANVFSQCGWIVNLTPKTGDQGADIVMRYRDLTAVVQCKLFSQPVGNGAVQEVIAAREYYRASVAIVVSNATYTTSARQLAAGANVALLHHNDIRNYSSKLGVETTAELSNG